MSTRGYPRPQLVREQWQTLEGPWDFTMESEGARHPSEVSWNSQIIIPFAPETRASGIGNTGFHPVCWYRRTLATPPYTSEQRVMLHLGAVDYSARVWVNGSFVVSHRGGYTPFSVDITDQLDGDRVTIAVRAEDDPQDLAMPRGKQDWHLEPHAIWYPRTTGIWQTVWLETVNEVHIGRILWKPSLVRWEFGFEAWLVGPQREDISINLRLNCKGKVLASDRYAVVHNEVHRRIALSDPGIDDYRNELLWSRARARAGVREESIHVQASSAKTRWPAAGVLFAPAPSWERAPSAQTRSPRTRRGNCERSR